ncbi:hypothetical protein GCM10028810_32400 [Spirosoma litoris]
MIRHENTERIISPFKVSSIAVTQGCLISSGAIQLAAKHQIPIYFFDTIGDVQASLQSPRFGTIATIRRHQVYFSDSAVATGWIAEVFALKNQQQTEVLRYLLNRRPSASEPIEQAISQITTTKPLLSPDQLTCPISALRQELLGKEGSQARAYWQAVAAALPNTLTFESRSRRPAVDSFNAALNYLYGMLYTSVENALLAAGLDPYLGLFHVDEYNAPTLAFDLIEPFRPWADRFLLDLCLDNMWQADFTDRKPDGGVCLNRIGKRFLIPRWNEYVNGMEPFHQYQTSRKNSIYRYANELRHKVESFALPF